MRTLAVFGATGGLGRHVVRQALEADHQVRALVRDPSRLDVDSPRLQVVQGDFGDRDAVATTLSGADAVLSCIGYAKGRPPEVYGQGMRFVLQAMQAEGTRRIVAISGAGLELEGDASGLGRRLIITALKLFGRNVLAGKQHEWEAIRDADVAWTLVRVARMVEAEPTGSVAVDLHRVSGSPVVAYPDVARWMLEQLEEDAYVGRAPFVSGS